MVKKARKYRGKLKTASEEERKQIKAELLAEYELYVEAYESMKKNLGDYISIKTIYLDDRGRFLSKEKARELRRKGIMPQRRRVYYLKTDLPEFGLKKGDKIPHEMKDKVFEHIKEEIRYHNTIVGVAMHNDLTFEEAKKLVDEYLEKYEKGEVEWWEVHEVFSP